VCRHICFKLKSFKLKRLDATPARGIHPSVNLSKHRCYRLSRRRSAGCVAVEFVAAACFFLFRRAVLNLPLNPY
jgi:hypothetical protein